MNKPDIELNIQNPKKAAAYVLLMIGILGFTAYNQLSDGPQPVKPKAEQSVAVSKAPVMDSGNTVKEPGNTKNGKKQAAPSKKADVKAPDMPEPVANILAINPFVEISEIAGDEIPAPAGYGAGTQPRGNIPLPAIPGAGSIPLPAGQMPGSSPSPAVPRENITVQGVLVGGDGGSMAIMSDGSLLTEGDTYRDGRITYIGGDGIRFDDGSSMDYK